MKSEEKQIGRKRTEAVSPDGQGGTGPMIGGALVVLLAAVAFSVRPVTDSDFWHHIAFGRMLVEDGVFPRVDLLGSTSEGRPWVSSGWIPATLLYLIYRAVPEVGPALMVSAVTGLMGLVIYGIGVGRSGLPALAALAAVLALGASHARFLPRPDLLSQLMMPILLVVLDRVDHGLAAPGRLRWSALVWVPCVFLLWANLHMLFVIGLAVLTVFVGAKLWSGGREEGVMGRGLLFMWGASILACLVSPNGFRAVWFVVENARLDKASERINELKPFLTIVGEPGAGVLFTLMAGWVAVTGYVIMMGVKRWKGQRGRSGAGWAEGRLWVVAAAVFIIAVGFTQRRQIGIVVPSLTVLAFLYFPRSLGELPLGAERRAGDADGGRLWRRPLAMGIPLAVLLVMHGFLVWAGSLPSPYRSQRLAGVSGEWFPWGAVGFLRDNPPPGRLFHDLYTGGFLGYHLAPQTKTFIDGRLEVFNNGTYDDFFGPPEGRFSVFELFDRYGVDSALLDWRDAHLQPLSTASILARHSEWRLCWFDDRYALFVREAAEGPAREYVAEHGYRFLNPLVPQGFMEALESGGDRPAAVAEARRALEDNPESRLARKGASVAGIIGE